MSISNIFLAVALFFSFSLWGDAFYERSPVDYEDGKEDNEVVRLQSKIDKGLKIEFDYKHGYLPGVLKALNISQESQLLVFSKTSAHRRLISPYNPRAIYFNKNSYVGWVNGAKFLELGVTDKNLGTVFYTLDQKKMGKPRFERDDTCLSCHASSRTDYEPGFLVRSIFPDKSGEIISRAGGEQVDHTTPINLRWGGWFVTADKFISPHRGNAVTVEKDNDFSLKSIPAKTTVDLQQFLNPENYLAKTSDVQALMVMEHQVKMQNILTSTKFRVMHALHNERIINKALKEMGRRQMTSKIISNAATEVLDYMLFVDELSLKKISIKGTDSFLKSFKKESPKTTKGDSLTDFVFKNRISKYPCSWLIYCDSFIGLPIELKSEVLSRLKKILTEKEIDDKYIHLRQTRAQIHQILMETHKSYKASQK